MDAPVTVFFWITNGIISWGCSSHCILLEHDRNSGLDMDATVTVFSWNTNGIMVWAWMLQLPYSCGNILLKGTELWFGHGCSGHRILLEYERNYGLGMDAPVTVFLWKLTELSFGLDVDISFDTQSPSCAEDFAKFIFFGNLRAYRLCWFYKVFGCYFGDLSCGAVPHFCVILINEIHDNAHRLGRKKCRSIKGGTVQLQMPQVL